MSLHSKLAEVMGEVTRIPKNGYNDFHKYAYVTETDLVEAVRDKLAKRQVMLYPSVEEVSREGTITTVRVKFTAADGESGETFEFWGAGCGDDKSDKGVYKALTGCLKYGLMKLFLVATGDDPEAETKSSRATGKRDAESSGRASQTRRDPVAPSKSGVGVVEQPPAPQGGVSGASSAPDQSSVPGPSTVEGKRPGKAPALAHDHDWKPAPNPDAAKRGFHVCAVCGLSQKDPK